MDQRQARLVPLAVFAAVVALGGGAAVFARGAGHGTARSAPPPLRLSLTSGAAQDKALVAAAPRAAGGAPASCCGKLVFDHDLGAVPTQGPVYQLVAGRADVAAVQRLADALHLTGVPVRDGASWVVSEGTRGLRVNDAPGNPWFYEAEHFDQSCRTDGPDVACASATSTGVAIACPPCAPGSPCAPCPTPSQPPLPTSADARAVAQPVFDAAGLADPAVTDYDAWDTRAVNADPAVHGLRTSGWTTTVSVDAQKTVQHANGSLGAARLLADDYRLLTPAEAGAKAGDGPRIMIACDADSPDCATQGADRHVTAAALALMYRYSYDQADPTAYLVPSWSLTIEGEDAAYDVNALPDEYLAPEPAPSDQPGQPTEPSAVPGSDGGADGSTGAPEPAPPKPTA